MDITSKKYFEEYEKTIGNLTPKLLEDYMFKNKVFDFEYQIQTSSVYSSNIEGNTIDLNSFMNYKLSKKKFSGKKELQEIENLIKAYIFAKENKLSELNLLKSHEIFSKTFLIKSKRGKYRQEQIGVFSTKGLVYLAIEPQFVQKEMNLFFSNIKILLEQELNLSEVFYFASLIHLKFVHIHPFTDGNGRAARLLEKWFLTEKLNDKLWVVPTEKYYKQQQSDYYKNIDLGVNFYELNYDKCLPFLTMLPNSLTI